MESSVMGSKRLTPIIVGKMASKYLLFVCIAYSVGQKFTIFSEKCYYMTFLLFNISV